MHLASLKSINQQTKHPSAKHRERWWRLPRFLERGSGMKAFADFRMAAQRHTSTSSVDSLCGTKARERLARRRGTVINFKNVDSCIYIGFYKNELVWLYILCGGFCNFLNQVLCVFSVEKCICSIYYWALTTCSTKCMLKSGQETQVRPSPFFHIQSCQSNLAKLCPRSLPHARTFFRHA